MNIEISTDKVIIIDADGNTCYLYPCLDYYPAGVDHVMVKDRSGNKFRLCPESTGLVDQMAILAFLEDANVQLGCAGGDVDPEYEFVGITTTLYCRLSDNKKVIIRTCKLEDGSIEITDTDSGATLTDATLASGYDAECAALECVCTEMSYQLQEGQTIDYEGLLAHFEAVGTFDDNSKGATGVSFIKYGNINKGGLSAVYNGTNTNNHAGSFSWGDDTKFNPVSTDLFIESNRGITTIAYVVYKCN